MNKILIGVVVVGIVVLGFFVWKGGSFYFDMKGKSVSLDEFKELKASESLGSDEVLLPENDVDESDEDVFVEKIEDIEEVRYSKAVFAGGCFWCMESDFEHLPGVVDVVSGYSGGSGDNPTYGNYGSMGYTEVIEVTYDSAVISYNELLERFWANVDPFDDGGQFCDRGREYISSIYYGNAEEKRLAEESRDKVAEILGKNVLTEIVAFDKFWEAEEYHQGYAERNGFRYKFYRTSCGRDARLKEVWSLVDMTLLSPDDKVLDFSSGEDKKFIKPTDEELKKFLTPIQYKVTQQEGTERAFDNEYWDNHEDGIYVDIVSGEVLFSSNDKFDSGTGWPSFTKSLVSGNVIELEDNRYFMQRTEVRSKLADSHLGHIFLDGLPPTYIRYCMNSASLRFVAVEDLEKEGYGEFVSEFE